MEAGPTRYATGIFTSTMKTNNEYSPIRTSCSPSNPPGSSPSPSASAKPATNSNCSRRVATHAEELAGWGGVPQVARAGRGDLLLLLSLAGMIVEASAWSLVVFICPDFPFSQGSVPPPEREQAELGRRSFYFHYPFGRQNSSNIDVSRGLPDLHGGVRATRGDVRPRQGPLCNEDCTAVSPVNVGVFPGGGIPDLRRLIGAAGDDTLAVGGPGDGRYHIR